jgi:hypothetical protein
MHGRFGQAIGLVLVISLAGSSCVATAAAAGDPPRIDDRFRLRVESLQAPAIPGRPLGGRPEGERRIVSARITINKGGGGESRIRANGGAEDPCNLPEILMEAIRVGAPFCGNSSNGVRVPLFDRDVFPTKALPPLFIQPLYGRLGTAVDDLASSEEVQTVVDGLAADRQSLNPLLDPVPARFDATVDLMDSPLASRTIRRWLVENLISASGATPQMDVRDPDGRPAALIEIPDTSRAGLIKLPVDGEVVSYDLTNAAETSLRLYYNPKTWDILSRQDALVSTTLSELQPFVASSAPASAVYFSTTYEPVRTVHRFRLVQYRVPCRKLAEADPDDNFCVEVGRPGGYEISLKLKRPWRRGLLLSARNAFGPDPSRTGRVTTSRVRHLAR